MPHWHNKGSGWKTAKASHSRICAGATHGGFTEEEMPGRPGTMSLGQRGESGWLGREVCSGPSACPLAWAWGPTAPWRPG